MVSIWMSGPCTYVYDDLDTGFTARNVIRYACSQCCSVSPANQIRATYTCTSQPHNMLVVPLCTAPGVHYLSVELVALTDSHMHAVNAARKVKVVYKSLGPPILSIKDAIEKNSFFPDPDPLMMGDEG